jgi:hypothetical protein
MKFKVQLTYACKVRMVKVFYKHMCKKEGLNLSDDSLANICVATADTFSLDHSGQEMELGDEPEQVMDTLRKSLTQQKNITA